ncbi:MAG: YesL family protein [Lachnospiraceae bacterium]|nr:YesL family protein [Lachnospiraceae bacterium]
MSFLHEDSPVTRFLSCFMDLILLNVLWILGCVPIVTAGASTAALYDMTMQMALHEEVHVCSGFFKSLIHHLKKGTFMFLLTAVAGIFLAVDLWCTFQPYVPYRFFLQVVVVSVGYFYLAAVSHAFPALAYFDEPVLKTLRYGLLLAMKNGIFTVFIMLLDLSPVILFFLFPVQFLQSLFLWFTVGFALIAWLNSLHLVRLFDPERVKAVEEAQEERRKARLRREALRDQD